MYKFKTTTNNILHFELREDIIIGIQKKHDGPYLVLLDSNLKLKDEVKKTTAYDFILFEENIFITQSKAYISYLIQFKESFIFNKKLDYSLNIKGEQYRDKYICSGLVNDVKNFLLIDLNTSELIKTMPMTLGFGFIDFFISENKIVSASNNSLGVFTLDNEEVWQLNINTLFATEDQSEINQIKIYNESLIIVSNEGIASIEINTGKVNWVTETYAITIEIVDNIGYACSGLALYKINLDTGVMSSYGWDNHRLPDIEYKNIFFWPSGYEVIYHNGLLWYTVYNSGASFIIAINPHDGYYEWVHYVEGSDKIDSIKFYQNRMYVLDIKGVLHVYEKEQ